MKLLLFSDLHCNTRLAKQLVEKSQQVDVVVGAGDFANFRRDLHLTIDILSGIQKPALLVAGNSESEIELESACRNWESAQVLHGSGVTIQGIDFYGLGGAVPVTPFGSWSYDLTESEAEGLLDGCPSGGVLVSHSPPKGLVDLSSTGQSLGSQAVRAIILERQPQLVVCGHIHESAGQRATVGKTLVINAGPEGLELELDPSAEGQRQSRNETAIQG